MGEDEVGTHERLMACRNVVDRLIARHDGRVVGNAGDAILADFPSVIEALSAAVDIQNELVEHNASYPPEQRLQFRIGINLGDVIVDGDDIFGDGVNVAARIESLADPGGIAISGAVYDQVKNKMDLDFHDRGPHRIKNIAEPVRVYAAGLRGGAKPQPTPQRLRRHVVKAAAAITLVVAVAAVFWNLGPTGIPSGPAEAPSPGKPTVAVLPFENRGGDAERSYFNDGITEDVIIDLGRFSSLLVLSWNAVAPYKGQNVALDQLSRDLNVRYVVGGTVRQTGDRLRVAVQLTDAERGVLLWSERYDESLDDVFAVQHQIAQQVVGALAVRLTRLERDRAFEKPTDNLDAYDHVLRGRDFLRRIERGSNLQARAMFERAKELDPDYSDAYVGLGSTHMHDFMFGWTEWPYRAIEQAQALAEHAVRLDERNALAHAWLAHILIFQKRYDRAEQEVERAIELNPNNAMGLAIKGLLMHHTGRPETAVPSIELALRLDPNPVPWWLVSLGISYYLLGRYEDAVRLFDEFEPRFAEDSAPYAVLAAAHGQLGHRDKAAQAVAKLRRVSPFFDADLFADNLGREQSSHLLEGLRKAGLQ